MILKKIAYFEHKGKPQYWEIKDVHLGKRNLIVGLNATGKTRLINIISNFSKIITKKIKLGNGHWELEFLGDQENETYKYILELSNGVITNEEIIRNGCKLLQRNQENGNIYSETTKKMVPFAPPRNELTIHVRRDQKEYPFLEQLHEWANNCYGYAFTNVTPNQVVVPNMPRSLLEPGALLENLSTVPYILVEALRNPEVETKIIDDFSRIGYPIEKISVVEKNVPGVSLGVPFIEIQEKDLKCATPQLAMSQGMYRAFSLIVIIEHILSIRQHCMVAIDDLGEGLDYQRATHIINLLFEKVKDSNIQLIVTSNDRFVINAVDSKDLILLERKGHIVVSFNYIKDKEKFDEFELTGLNNFDFFSGEMYKEEKDD